MATVEIGQKIKKPKVRKRYKENRSLEVRKDENKQLSKKKSIQKERQNRKGEKREVSLAMIDTKHP
jgi:hypothetical protein